MSCINTLADENKRVQELFYQDNEILKIQQRTFGQLFRKFIESELKKCKRKPARDFLYLVTIVSSAPVQRKIVIILYVLKKILCMDNSKGNSLVVPLLE